MRVLALAIIICVVGTACRSAPQATVIVQSPETSNASRPPAPSAASGADRTAAPTEAASCGTRYQPGDSIETLISDGSERTYRLHIPTGYDSATPAPLVVNYHGYDRSAEDQERYSGLVPVADAHGFVLVTPEGLDSPQWWQVVDVEPDSTLIDVDFTRDLIGQLRTELCVDPGRMYATGMSNGAEMAAQVGCLLPELFAAVAPVAGVVFQDCDRGPMPVLAFNGTDDFNVPFETAEPAMADWAQRNQCAAADPSTSRVSDHVTRESYAGCGGNDVVLYVIDGGGHTWPGAEDDAPHGGVGATTHEISASELIWQFFAAHTK
jgi:polyhydroxybutyrate depolymerase